jgi:hypothetical protein
MHKFYIQNIKTYLIKTLIDGLIFLFFNLNFVIKLHQKINTYLKKSNCDIFLNSHKQLNFMKRFNRNEQTSMFFFNLYV